MTSARPPAPTPPAVGPATCQAAAQLATAAAQLLTSSRHELRTRDDRPPIRVDESRPGPDERAEAARMLRAAADLIAPPASGPRGPLSPSPPPKPGDDGKVVPLGKSAPDGGDPPRLQPRPGPRPLPSPADLARWGRRG